MRYVGDFEWATEHQEVEYEDCGADFGGECMGEYCRRPAGHRGRHRHHPVRHELITLEAVALAAWKRGKNP